MTGEKRLKICIISPNYPPNSIKCGVGDYTRMLCEEISKLGHDIVVIASKEGVEELRGKIRVIPFSDRWGLKALIRLIRFINSERFDLINLQYSPPLYGFLFKFFSPIIRLNSPFVITVHTLYGGAAWNKLIAFIFFIFSSKVISTNEEVDYIVEKHLYLFKDKVISIPIGSNIAIIDISPDEAKEKVETELRIREKDIILSHFGLYYPGKGVETILEALRVLKDEYDNFYMLMLGGIWPGKESYYQSLIDLSKKFGLASSITWVGYCDEEKVSLYLTATDIFLIPYDHGVSIRRGSLMAGLAHKLPIVSTLSSVPTKYFKNNKNILLVPSKNPLALKRAILDLINDTEKRKLLSRGTNLLNEEFSWEKIANRTITLFDKEVYG